VVVGSGVVPGDFGFAGRDTFRAVAVLELTCHRRFAAIDAFELDLTHPVVIARSEFQGSQGIVLGAPRREVITANRWEGSLRDRLIETLKGPKV
jgi:hypothetical protein